LVSIELHMIVARDKLMWHCGNFWKFLALFLSEMSCLCFPDFR